MIDSTVRKKKRGGCVAETVEDEAQGTRSRDLQVRLRRLFTCAFV